jgi:hypothetical protein
MSQTQHQFRPNTGVEGSVIDPRNQINVVSRHHKNIPPLSIAALDLIASKLLQFWAEFGFNCQKLQVKMLAVYQSLKWSEMAPA